ncbi:MAG: hypothetical protein DDT26_00109 [Dehalococcoidia bacterium]|nr:hypothetical protein [Chloroflexota bacterium]
MQNVTGPLAATLNSRMPTLAMCWLVTRRDGSQRAFTSHDQDLRFAGHTFQATGGLDPSAFSSDDKLSTNNQELRGFLTVSGITQRDLVAGLYQGAAVLVFLVNYLVPPASLTGTELLILARGWIGQTVNEGGLFYKAEVRGLTSLLQQTIGETTSSLCRASFGDSRCKINKFFYSVNIQVSHVFWFDTFTINLFSNDGFLTNGNITFTTGANAGVSREIIQQSGAFIRLLHNLPFAPSAGDSGFVLAGCGKTILNCLQFGNAANFQGEPHLPGNDRFISGNFKGV